MSTVSGRISLEFLTPHIWCYYFVTYSLYRDKLPINSGVEILFILMGVGQAYRLLSQNLIEAFKKASPGKEVSPEKSGEEVDREEVKLHALIVIGYLVLMASPGSHFHRAYRIHRLSQEIDIEDYHQSLVLKHRVTDSQWQYGKPCRAVVIDGFSSSWGWPQEDLPNWCFYSLVERCQTQMARVNSPERLRRVIDLHYLGLCG